MINKKELIGLIVLGVVLVVLGGALVSYFGNIEQQRQKEVDVVREIQPEFNQEAQDILSGTHPEETIGDTPTSIGASGDLGNQQPFRSEE